LRTGCIEQRAALVGIFIERGEVFAVLAPLDQWLAFRFVNLSETAEPGLHIAQPVAAFGELTFVDDVDAGFALLGDDGGNVIRKPRVVAGREASVR
jgi:hypothetical protein